MKRQKHFKRRKASLAATLAQSVGKGMRLYGANMAKYHAKLDRGVRRLREVAESSSMTRYEEGQMLDALRSVDLAAEALAEAYARMREAASDLENLR